VTNTTDIPFEPGPVTFFEEGRYTGETVLSYLSRGEKRLVSYGIDHDIQVATKTQAQPEIMARLTIERGVAVLFMERTQTTTYEVRSKATANKTLIVEHPRFGDRKLKGEEPWETSDSFYRYRIVLKPSAATEMPVTEIISRQTNVSLNSLNRQQLVSLFSNKQTPQQVQTRLGQIVDTQEQIAAMRNNERLAEQSIETLFKDQERLRENIKALRDTREEQELRSRYLDQLTKQENQIAATRAQVEQFKRDIAAAESRLNELIATFSWQG
jgi:DNA repair exonuclease SbcCD ATPase subunit